MKSYMDAGKKAKESKGLKNSFYAGSFKPIKFTKSGTQFTKRPSNSAKFKVPKKKPLAKKTDDAFESNQSQTGETTTEKTNEI